jgi:CubicO group peptidase (beta-lactamase class C family)/D-alanyl-D-alanine dipeptidase
MQNQQKASAVRKRAPAWASAAAAIVACAFGGGVEKAARAQPAVPPRGRYAEVVKRLEPWIAQEAVAKGLPALSIALVDGGEIVWARGFGFVDPAKKTAATAETVYRVGSVSKLFTDLAIMQLVEQGRLDLDAPASTVVTEFAPRNPFPAPIRVRHLMSHLSGLVREPPVGHYFDPHPPPLLDVVRSLSATTLLFEPGSRTKYSNAGVTVLGAIVERASGMPFSQAMERALLAPLGMSHSSFEPPPALKQQTAHGSMWAYDGRSVATPEFLLGTGPAGNLVSTVVDLSRFLSFLFGEGRGANAQSVVKPQTLRTMLEPQQGTAKEPAGFGLGFAVSSLSGERRIGHAGAVYGFATDLQALPEAKLGVVASASLDCANGIVGHIVESALLQMLALRQHKDPPALETTTPLPKERLRALEGRYVHAEKTLDLYDRGGKLLLDSHPGGMRVELRVLGDSLIVDDRLARGPKLSVEPGRIGWNGTWYENKPVAKPASCPARWQGLIGEYGPDHDVLYILEKDGRLHALIEWFFDYPLEEAGSGRFRFPDYGLYSGESLVFTRDAQGRATAAEAAGVLFSRRTLNGEGGKTVRIPPQRPVEAIRREIASAQPPAEPGPFREPDLVELAALDPTIRLDIQYATSNNFLGVPLYTSGRAFLQRPAAVALLKAHRALERHGYGLLIHDAYRPWRVTKLFWEATPEPSRIFVADPSKGSRHNRGAAVDLTLYERNTGQPAEMVGNYDEFSPRSFPDYPGGTSLQRWQRDLLRRAMEDEGFTVYEFEWWHFDDRDWAKYPILDRPFETVR